MTTPLIVSDKINSFTSAWLIYCQTYYIRPTEKFYHTYKFLKSFSVRLMMFMEMTVEGSGEI